MNVNAQDLVDELTKQIGTLTVEKTQYMILINDLQKKNSELEQRVNELQNNSKKNK